MCVFFTFFCQFFTYVINRTKQKPYTIFFAPKGNCFLALFGSAAGSAEQFQSRNLQLSFVFALEMVNLKNIETNLKKYFKMISLI